MSWWGKLLGGALGFAMGGPLGALVGTALGHRLDTRTGADTARNDAGWQEGPELIQTAFFSATFSVMGHMSKADGEVTEDEIQLASTVMRRMALPPALRHFARELFRQGKSADFPLDRVLEQLRGQVRSRNLLRMFLEIQVFAAYADGTVHVRERAILEHICAFLGFGARTLEQVERLVRAELQHEFSARRGSPHEQALAGAHAVLGVEPGADDASVKRAYRRLMSQHHPDKLVSRGLPEEMMQLATQKTQEIKAAYELITQARRRR